MSEIRIRFVVLGLIFACVGPLAAQDQPVEKAKQVIANTRNKQLQRQMQAATRAQRKSLQREMDIEIDALQRICRLSEPQAKKLQIASKGAIDRALEKWAKQMGWFQGRLGQGNVVFGNAGAGIAGQVIRGEEAVDNADDAVEKADLPAKAAAKKEAREDVEEAAIAEADALAAAGQAFQMWNFNGNSVSATKEKIWTSTVSKVLTAEQTERMNTASRRRRAFRRKASIENTIAHIDARLLLTEEQRVELFKLVDRSVGRSFESSTQRGNGVFNFVQLNAVGALQKVPRDEVAKILTKPQLARWNEVSGTGRNFLFFNQGHIQVEEAVEIER